SAPAGTTGPGGAPVGPVVPVWPASADELAEVQSDLAAALPERWRPWSGVAVGGCFVCFERGRSGPGHAGERGWAGAAVMAGGKVVATATTAGVAGAPYQPGLLALREGSLLEAAVRDLDVVPDVLLVNATGLDHPRGAGLALHLGAVL